MTLWLAFALMTAAAIFAVLWPLSRTGTQRSGSDAEVYRDQLDEIARDSAAGLIGPAEAEAARVEVSRRLIAARDAEQERAPPDPTRAVMRRRVVAVVALVAVPGLAAALYLVNGSPQLPGEPLAARMAQARQTGSIAGMIARVARPISARRWSRRRTASLRSTPSGPSNARWRSKATM